MLLTADAAVGTMEAGVIAAKRENGLGGVMESWMRLRS